MANVKVTFNRAATIAKIRAANDRALVIMGNQALMDTQQYVPEDQGTLKQSGDSSSDMTPHDGAITLRWATPYARYLWKGDVMHGNPTNRTYGPEKLTFTKALARMEWAIYAHKVHGTEWKKVYENALKGALRG